MRTNEDFRKRDDMDEFSGLIKHCSCLYGNRRNVYPVEGGTEARFLEENYFAAIFYEYRDAHVCLSDVPSDAVGNG